MLVDLPGVWMYGNIMALRRISTPLDLGAAVRDARTAAQLTQAELAERAGVSREWLIGLERGTRPRAELTKILGVLAALDQPLMLGREEAAEVQEEDEEPARDGAPMTTAEVTRRAIEQSWPTTFRAAATSAAAVAAATQTPSLSGILSKDGEPAAPAAALEQLARVTANLPRPDFSHFLAQYADMIPRMDVSAFLPKTDLAAMFPRADFSSLMPQPSPALVTLMQTLSATQDAARDDDGADDEGDSEEGRDTASGARRDDDTVVDHAPAQDADEVTESQDGLW